MGIGSFADTDVAEADRSYFVPSNRVSLTGFEFVAFEALVEIRSPLKALF